MGTRSFVQKLMTGLLSALNTALVAPIRIGEGALVGAGSTLTDPALRGRLPKVALSNELLRTVLRIFMDAVVGKNPKSSS